ncbi:PH domain-containing protein [Microbacterium sp. BK668]|uniref:PH domain-containing protein n=1 Tax=Microbacterium sp. BK668 TaxID=2512118 RepID=UPI0010F23CB5|nr:PH domain-containing protein [Microbacterium sp. BK668]TDN90778.1 putative membrane protein [Microbacterium sp. BK668]
MTDDPRPGGAPPDPQATAMDAASPAPPQTLVRSPLSDGDWHRLHPLTPLLRGGLFLVVVIGIVIANLRDRLVYLFLPMFAPDLPAEELEEWEGAGDPIDFIVANNLYLAAGVAVLLVLIALTVIFYLSWRFHTFRITGDDVEVRSGILFRTQRRAPLDRVQGVNLTRPMLARLLGMAKLEVVGAGTDANVKLEYLSTANAEAVRADILRLASGRRLGEGGARASDGAARSRVGALGQSVSRGITGLIEGDEAPAPVPDSVVSIPVPRLIVSHVISPSTVFLLVGIAAIATGSALGSPWVLFAMVPTIIGFVAYWIRSIVRSLRYSIAPTPDGVRITFGLLTTITEIVPPGRVHAVEVTQSILWRAFGWWTIRINRLTGRSLSDSSTDQFTTVLPVGTTADVERVLRLLLPDVPPDEWPVIVREGMLGPEQDDTFVTTPRRAWFLRPLSWRRNGFRLTADALLLRRGVIWRKLAVIPLARMQSLALHQGPVDRLARVASARAHTVMGPVYSAVNAIDRDAALELFTDAAAGAVRAASVDRSHRWAQESA